ncbi:MAG: hypothetical protein FWH17_09695 [Oscillospiraceae bacterium]|nr:hypothetical protein [Oscillospiraceae bacterium]
MSIAAILRSLNIPTEYSQYYYNQLTGEQKHIYQIIIAGIMVFSKKIKMPLRPVNELSKIWSYIMRDNPLLFYVSSFACQNDLYKQKCVFIPEYRYEPSRIKETMDAVVSNLQVFGAVKGRSDLEKEQFVHDYCSEHFSYGDIGDESHTILGSILHKTAVCEGIANYVKAVLDYLGVGSIVVSGKAQSPFYHDKMENHAWNIVKADGAACHLDVTFDMTIKNKHIRYDYFNLCDDDIRKDHVIVGNVPKCTTAGKDYYTYNDMAAQGKNGLENYIARKVKSGDKTIIVKLAGAENVNDICDKVMKVAGQTYANIKGSGVSLEINANISQSVFEINFK